MKNSHLMEARRKENEAVSKIKTDPKYFYRYARDKSLMQTTIGPLVEDEVMVSEPGKKAQILQNQYMSVYSCDGYQVEIISDINSIPGPRSVESFEVTVDDMESAIDSLSLTSASGPDGVPAVLLKNCKKVLTRPLIMLWQKSLEMGVVPSELKLGYVVPVHKGGDKCSPKNYRPITLTSHIIKLIEKIIVKKLVDYMSDVGLFNSRQHGFRQNRSCLSQLLEHYQLIIQCMESGQGVPVVYLDFCKAFDKVDHKLVLEKLRSMGISGNLLRWIGSFLLNRKQIVVVDKARSFENEVKSGVPQGSVLGPLLFLILISDIDMELEHAKASSYADDTKVVGSAPGITQELMQGELNKVYHWAKENRMKFNDSKFQHLQYNTSRTNNLEFEFKTETGLTIDRPDSVKDLGVMMDNDGRFVTHIEEITAKARRHAGWILRTFSARDPLTMLTLYKSLVRPILEYCSQLWSPLSLGLIRKIEGVQRNFTARIDEMNHLSYWSRLENLDLYSMERRRERYSVLYVHKILTGLAPNFEEERFKIKTTYSERRGLQCRMPPVVSSATGRIKTLADQSFAVRGPKLYNELPIKLRDIEQNFKAFKTGLDTFLSHVPDKPCLPGYHQQSASNRLLDQVQQLKRDGLYYSL